MRLFCKCTHNNMLLLEEGRAANVMPYLPPSPVSIFPYSIQRPRALSSPPVVVPVTSGLTVCLRVSFLLVKEGSEFWDWM